MPRTTTQVDLAVGRLEKLIGSSRRSGELRLPRETELSEQLGISRNTLREALARLAGRGLIDRQRRLGTFIVPDGTDAAAEAPQRLLYPIDEIVTLPDFFDGTGSSYGIRSVAVETETASRAVREALTLEQGASVFRVRRVFAQGDVGAAVGEHVLATTVNGRTIHLDSLADGISTFLKDVENIDVSVVRHTVTAIGADAATARDLRIPMSSPVLVISADLCAQENGIETVVAIGRLLLNPTVLSVSATARAPETSAI